VKLAQQGGRLKNALGEAFMRLKSVILGSTSAFVLAFGATPAAAQSDPATPPDPNVEAQEQPADPEAGSPQTDDAVEGVTGADEPAEEETIVVTGLRRSLRSAQNIKRNSEQIVDSIVAEDIGKLPDLAVSETAARIPGVQVIRRAGEADTVLIRGLPDFATLYNGREIFTAETRVVALQDFPSANIAALEVFKTTTANLAEAGLAGLINVRSRRPFDFKDSEFAGSVWALHTKQANKWNPNFNLLGTTRWNAGDGEMGLLVNISRTELDFLDSEPSNTDFVADPIINGQRVRFPDIQRLFYRSGNRVRPSANASFQWRPQRGLEFYAEALYQGFRNKVDDRLVAVPLYGGGSYTNLQFRSGTNILRSGTINGLADPIFTFQGGTFNKTNTYQVAVGGSFETGPLRLSADIARSKSRFKGSTESVDRIFAGQGTTSVDFDLDTPQFTIRNFDVNNPNNYLFDGLYEEDQESKGDDVQARFDAEYTTGFAFMPKIQAGVRFTNRDAHREFGNRFAGFRGRGINAANLPLEFELTPPGFRGTGVQSGFNSFLSPTYESIRRNREELRQFVINQGITCCFGTFTTDAPQAFTVFDAFEETLAGYGQLNFQMREWLDAVVGIRAVRSDVRVTGGVPGPIPQFNSGSRNTDWLPNASIRARVTPELQIRLSATQTRTRPNFGDLNPSGTLGQPPQSCPPSPDPFTCARTGSTGNPFLQSFTSDNYDAGIEYYFSRTGFIAGTVFRRDLFGFIQRGDVRILDPQLGPIIINQPLNTGKGRIDGVEGQVSTFFDFEFLPRWARGFGAQANFTYLDAKTGFPTSGGDLVLDRILGVSKWTYNLVGMYEQGGLSARLSYNKRGKFLDRRDDRGDDLYIEEAVPPGRLDLSSSYTINENFSVFFDWTNILEDPFKVNLESGRAGAPRAQFVRFLRFEETTYSLGMRFRF
jgi:TonB-dependent receptor